MIKLLSGASLFQPKNSYLQVFSSNDPFSDCFKKEIKKINLLCPVDGYYLNFDQYISLIKTLEYIDKDDRIFISEIETKSIEDVFKSSRGNNEYELKHWELDLKTTYEEYLKIEINLENAIYSSKGTWGIVISHEEHAVIGGSNEFINKFNIEYPLFEGSMNSFQEKWEYNKKNYNSDMTWYNLFIKSLEKR